MKPQIIIICGPTASGKSQLSIDLANKINGEIISADSLAVYKKLDIGTAKPTKLEQSLAPHHLIDVVEPTENFSVFDYEKLSLSVIENLLKNEKVPIICGGTGFYINSILYKLKYGNSTGNLEVRNKFKNLILEKGIDYVYNHLIEVDSESAKKIHKNDTTRVIRALEIFYSTGEKKSSQNDKLIPRFSYIAVMKDFERQELYNRINERVDKMIENGLYDEVKSLIDQNITIENQCMQGIGYKEVYCGLINNSMEGVSDLIKLNSRHYAKRQITFFKRLENLKFVNKNNDIALQEVLKMYNEF